MQFIIPRPICPLLELHYVRMTSRTCSCRSGMRTNYVICWMEPWRNPLIRGPWVISVLTSVPLSNHVFLSTWITGKGGKIFYAILSVKWGAPALFFCHCTIPRKMWASVFLASIRKVIVYYCSMLLFFLWYGFTGYSITESQDYGDCKWHYGVLWHASWISFFLFG